MPDPKPLATWMFEQQKVANDRAYRLQNAAALAHATTAIGAIDPAPAAKPLAPTHDWQHSDDLAAHRAQGLEKQYLDAALDKDKMAFQMELRKKYAPKGGGINPLSKLWKEYFDTHDRKDYSSKEQQTAHLAAIVERAKRYPGGGRFVEDLAKAKALPTDYAPGQRTSEIPLRTVEIREKGAETRAGMTAAQRAAEANMRAQDRAAERDLKAQTSLAHIKVDPMMGDPSVSAAQTQAVGKLSKYKSPLFRFNPETKELEEDDGE